MPLTPPRPPQFITKDSGTREEFASGMVRDTREGKGRYDLIPTRPLRRLAQVYERGAVKYSDWNWAKGAPMCRFADSALRHIQQWLEGDNSEDHLLQAVFNLFAIAHFEELGRTDLDDRPDWTKPFDICEVMAKAQAGRGEA